MCVPTYKHNSRRGGGVCVGGVCVGWVRVCGCGVVGGLMGFLCSVFNFSAIDL